MAQTNCPVCQAIMAGHARYCGGCGSAIVPTKSAQFPAQTSELHLLGQEIVGRYRITTKIGEGGMGAVYQAEQISLKRKIALKVLRPEMSANKDLVRRFNAEAELAAKLNHPNTVTLYDFGQDESGTLFIAMEYIEGRSLRETIVREGPLSLPRIINITSQVCSSLGDAHRAGIIHRDLKPDNVMLSDRARKRDQVTVLDFGIAKLRDIKGDITQQPMTQVGDMLGTPQYMAPEQIRGHKVDARTDVYALGVMLYEMVTARLPFDGSTIMALLSKHLTEDPVSPAERRPELNVHPDLSALVMRCLEKLPDDRPSSMEEMEDLLDSISTPTPQNQSPQTASKSLSSSGYPPVGQEAMAVIAETVTADRLAYNSSSSRGNNAQEQVRTAAIGHTPVLNTGRKLQARKRSSSVWAIPLFAVLLAAGGAGAYYYVTEIRNNDLADPDNVKVESPNHEPNAPLGTYGIYQDGAFGYTFKIPTGFRGDGNSLGEASFVGEVHGIAQHIYLKAWAGYPDNQQAMQKNITEFFSTNMGLSVDRAEWKTIDDLRILHGKASDSGTDAEFMLTHIDSTYYVVIISGKSSDNPSLQHFRNSVFKDRIDLHLEKN